MHPFLDGLAIQHLCVILVQEKGVIRLLLILRIIRGTHLFLTYANNQVYINLIYTCLVLNIYFIYLIQQKIKIVIISLPNSLLMNLDYMYMSMSLMFSTMFNKSFFHFQQPWDFMVGCYINKYWYKNKTFQFIQLKCLLLAGII